MTNMTETIVINGTKEAAEAIRNLIDAQPNTQSHLTERKNLDGSAAVWILVGGIAREALPHLFGLIKDYLAAKQVKKIKVGDIEIENPTPEDIERFRAMINSRLQTND